VQLPAIVAFGSNQGERRETILAAKARLATIFGRPTAFSTLLETPAWIHPDDTADRHPSFLNGIGVFLTDQAPDAVLQALLATEITLGRTRPPHARPWQPRPIDLDLIALGDLVCATPSLVLPHPRMHHRDFVLGPLVEIWPDWRHPTLERTAADLLAELGGAAER
jgi:2-amino-4-hydroxy-6-hydroxymethyldihydropteridine diphosphokinase